MAGDYRVVAKDVLDDVQPAGFLLYVWLQDESSDLPGRWHQVSDLVQAARRCRDFIESRSMGGSDWNGGHVTAWPPDYSFNREMTPEALSYWYREYARQIAVVAYNGRVYARKATDSGFNTLVVDWQKGGKSRAASS